jgi:hypothetical protein
MFGDAAFTAGPTLAGFKGFGALNADDSAVLNGILRNSPPGANSVGG